MYGIGATPLGGAGGGIVFWLKDVVGGGVGLVTGGGLVPPIEGGGPTEVVLLEGGIVGGKDCWPLLGA